MFIMAQIGGFYSFLRLVFKIFFGLVSEKMFIIELLNKLRVKMKEIKTYHKIKKTNIGRIGRSYLNIWLSKIQLKFYYFLNIFDYSNKLIKTNIISYS